MDPNKLQKLDRLGQAEEIDLQAWMEEFAHIYSNLSPEKRAYSMIKAFFKIEKPSKKEYRDFIGWLVSEENKKAKTEALGKVFDEVSEQNLNIE